MNSIINIRKVFPALATLGDNVPLPITVSPSDVLAALAKRVIIACHASEEEGGHSYYLLEQGAEAAEKFGTWCFHSHIHSPLEIHSRTVGELEREINHMRLYICWSATIDAALQKIRIQIECDDAPHGQMGKAFLAAMKLLS